LSLLDLQRILARIVTEPDLRERFLNDPQQVAGSQAWATDPACALATVPPDRLRHYGESLIKKRCREATRCLPLTLMVLGHARFRTLFHQYARTSTTRGPARHRDDAIAFADRLRSDRSDVPEYPVWLADLAAYEAASLRAGDPKRRLVLLRLGHSPQDLVTAALSQNAAATLPIRVSLIAWIRLTRTGPSRQFRLVIPWSSIQGRRVPEGRSLRRPGAKAEAAGASLRSSPATRGLVPRRQISTSTCQSKCDGTLGADRT
jgi:hypothetical protein